MSPKVLLAVLGLSAVSLVQAQSSYPIGKITPPFTQCPHVGAAVTCSVLIYYDASGNTHTATDSSQPPYDNIEDSLVGIQNNSPNRIFFIRLKNPDIFGFDNDGVCGTDPNSPTGAPITPRPPGCPFGPTGYEGPGVSFTVYDSDNGTVSFVCPQFCEPDGKTPSGLLPGQSAWFTLEETPSVASSSISSVCGTAPDAISTFTVKFPAGDVCNSSTKGQPRISTWGSFGTSQFLTATSGEKLELRCDSYPSGASGAAYLLFYTPAPPAPQTAVPVGIDPWPNGCDSVTFDAVAASTTQAKCVASTTFKSWDYGGSKTFPNAFQSLTQGVDQNSIDRFVSNFDARSGGLQKILELYPPPAPPGTLAGFYPHSCNVGADPQSQAGTLSETRIVVDPPVGPITNAFFQSVASALASGPIGSQQASIFSPADFNHDGKIDMSDFIVFQKALGSCIGKPLFNGAADLDGDGCVTLKDYQIWFQLYSVH